MIPEWVTMEEMCTVHRRQRLLEDQIASIHRKVCVGLHQVIHFTPKLNLHRTNALKKASS